MKKFLNKLLNSAFYAGIAAVVFMFCANVIDDFVFRTNNEPFIFATFIYFCLIMFSLLFFFTEWNREKDGGRKEEKE